MCIEGNGNNQSINQSQSAVVLGGGDEATDK